MSPQETTDAIRQRLLAALPGCRADVRAAEPGHYRIEVEAEQFKCLDSLKKQRMVYSAIKDLMAGADAPVHAVDSLVVRAPAGEP